MIRKDVFRPPVPDLTTSTLEKITRLYVFLSFPWPKTIIRRELVSYVTAHFFVKSEDMPSNLQSLITCTISIEDSV